MNRYNTPQGKGTFIADWFVFDVADWFIADCSGAGKEGAPAFTAEQGTVAEAAGAPLPRAEQRSDAI